MEAGTGAGAAGADGSAGPDRKALLEHVRRLLTERKREYAGELANLDEAAAGETKSSAGDKYETAREMIAQSRSLIARNLAEAEANLLALERMEKAGPGAGVVLGSLVETTLGWYLVGVSLGELHVQGLTVRTLSLASPLGSALRGRRAGESVPWRGSSFGILRIVPAGG